MSAVISKGRYKADATIHLKLTKAHPLVRYIQEYESERYPHLHVDVLAGDFYIVDDNYKIIAGTPSFKTKQAASDFMHKAIVLARS